MGSIGSVESMRPRCGEAAPKERPGIDPTDSTDEIDEIEFPEPSEGARGRLDFVDGVDWVGGVDEAAVRGGPPPYCGLKPTAILW